MSSEHASTDSEDLQQANQHCDGGCRVDEEVLYFITLNVWRGAVVIGDDLVQGIAQQQGGQGEGSWVVVILYFGECSTARSSKHTHGNLGGQTQESVEQRGHKRRVQPQDGRQICQQRIRNA